MRGAIRDFIAVTTQYEVCDSAGDRVSLMQKAAECHCDLILLHLRTPLSDSAERASLLRSKLPNVKVIGFSSMDLGKPAAAVTGFDAVITKQDGLSKLIETLKGLMPEPPRD